MSVQRYECGMTNAPTEWQSPTMYQDANGGYVSYEAYAALEARYAALLDELEAKDKSISFLKNQLAQLANFNPDWDKLEAATYSLREHMAELTAARKRIAELTEIIRSGRKFISEYAGLGDVSAAEFIKIIDRAVANKGIN